jgi:hypothetical protein
MDPAKDGSKSTDQPVAPIWSGSDARTDLILGAQVEGVCCKAPVVARPTADSAADFKADLKSWFRSIQELSDRHDTFGSIGPRLAPDQQGDAKHRHQDEWDRAEEPEGRRHGEIV